MTLYDISDEIQAKCNAITEVGVDAPEAEGLFAELDELYANREDKHESYVRLIRHCEAMDKAMKAESQLFLKRARGMKNLATRLKERLMDDMRRHGEDSTDAGLFTIRRQLSAIAVRLDIPPELLPPQFQKIQVSPNKTLLKKALEAGTPIEGAELQRGEHLRIRARK